MNPMTPSGNPVEEWVNADAELTDRLAGGLSDADTDGDIPSLRPQQLFFPTTSDNDKGQSDSIGLEASTHGTKALTSQRAQATTQSEDPTGRTNTTAQEPEKAPDCLAISQGLPEWFQAFARSYRPRPSGEPASLSLSGLPPKAASTIPTSEPHQTPKRQYEPRDGNKSDSERAKKTLRAKKPRNSEFHAAIKFACPFYKRKPELHFKHTSCRASGFPNVHRVKCQRTFDEQRDLEEHYRAETELKCPRLDRPIADGITKAQKDLLDKPSRKGQREEEKWDNVYRILFPLDAVPSPYWNTRTPGQRSECCSNLSHSFETTLEDFESYFSRGSSRRLRDHLANDNNSLCLSDSQKSGLCDLFSEVSSELIGEFKAYKSQQRTGGGYDNETAQLKGNPPECRDPSDIRYNPIAGPDYLISGFCSDTRAYEEVDPLSTGQGGEPSGRQEKGLGSSSRRTELIARSLQAARGIKGRDFRYDATAKTIDPAVFHTPGSQLGAAFASEPRVAQPAPHETSEKDDAATTSESHADMSYFDTWNPWGDTGFTSVFADEVVAGFTNLEEEQGEALEPMEDAIAKL